MIKKKSFQSDQQFLSHNPSDFFQQQAVATSFGQPEVGWVILSSAEARIKAKIEEAGTPLKEWDIQINYGIKTGFNEAFIIDSKTKDELIRQSPESAEIIRPVLRGKDIGRYQADFADLWLLFIPWHFPLHLDPSITGNSAVAETQLKLDYPTIYEHLAKYKRELLLRNQSETGIRYEWYAMQRFGSNYADDFHKNKIIWGNLNIEATFSYDSQGSYILAPCNMLTSANNDLYYLLGVLNSPVTTYFMRHQGYSREGGYVEYKRIFVEQLPIPNLPIEERVMFDELVKLIYERKANNQDIEYAQAELNKSIFKLYNFSEEEIRIITF